MWILINFAFMCLSLWVAFSPNFRPISWPIFWINIFAAAINLLSIFLHIAGWLALL